MIHWRKVCTASATCVLLVLALAGAEEAPERGALDEFDLMHPLPVEEGQPPRIILGDINGFVRVFEERAEAFEEVWTSEEFEGAIFALQIVDINADDLDEIVVFTDRGRIHYLDVRTYKSLWDNPPNEYQRITALTIEDVDDDPQPELIFCADGRLIIYDGSNQFEEWRSDQTEIKAVDIVVEDVDGDDEEEIVLNDGYVFDARFLDLEWQSPESFGERMGLLDIDNDGIIEVIGEFRGRFIRIFDIDLRREKSIIR